MVLRYPVDALTEFVRDVLLRHGVSDEHAAVTADRMLAADLRGMSGHGILRLPAYVQRITEGGYNLEPDIRIVHQTPTSALVDGDNGLGQVVVSFAVATALEKAAASGMAWVGIRGSNHAGAGGVYAAMAAEQDMIGLYMAVGNANHMPPWGGAEALLSTNPIAAAIPAGEEPPLVLDMATTIVSYGRVKVAAERGETMPEGWVVHRDGTPITDPADAHEGFLVPIGGYKGYGLNLVIGMLAGVLNGGAFGRDVLDFNADFASPTNTGQLIMVVRPDLFRPLDEFKAEMDEHLRALKTSAVVPGQPPVRVPGDRVVERARDMHADGVPLQEATVQRLRDIGQRSGVTSRPFG